MRGGCASCNKKPEMLSGFSLSETGSAGIFDSSLNHTYEMKRNFLTFVLCSGLMISEHVSAQEMTALVPTSAEAVCPLKPGMSVPPLTLHTSDGQAFDLNKALRAKPTVLVFYRGGWCPYCTIQLRQLREVEPKLIDLGYQLIAICTDSPSRLQETETREAIRYTLLSDSTMTASRAFGIAFRVDEKTVELYRRHNMDLEAASGESHHLLPVPSVFIVGTDGRIKFAYTNPNYKVRLEPELLLSAARAAAR